MNKMIFKKTIVCPVCKTESKVNSLKKGAYRIIGQDIDLELHYSGLNPLYYDVISCNNCGYTDVSKYFSKIKSKEIPNILFNISKPWIPRIVPDEHNTLYAIKLYKLALLNRLYVKKDKKGELAVITLRLSYLYKALNDNQNINKFRKHTLECLTEAYRIESFPIGELFDQYYAEYLLAMLNYYDNNKNEAIKWVGKVIVNPFTPHKIKEKARDLKELIDTM